MPASAAYHTPARRLLCYLMGCGPSNKIKRAVAGMALRSERTRIGSGSPGRDRSTANEGGALLKKIEFLVDMEYFRGYSHVMIMWPGRNRPLGCRLGAGMACRLWFPQPENMRCAYSDAS